MNDKRHMTNSELRKSKNYTNSVGIDIKER